MTVRAVVGNKKNFVLKTKRHLRELVHGNVKDREGRDLKSLVREKRKPHISKLQNPRLIGPEREKKVSALVFLVFLVCQGSM